MAASHSHADSARSDSTSDSQHAADNDEAAKPCWPCAQKGLLCQVKDDDSKCIHCQADRGKHCNANGNVPAYRRPIKTKIYKRLCQEGAKQGKGDPAEIPCNPRDWKESLVTLATRFGLEDLLNDDDYLNEGLALPAHRLAKASASPPPRHSSPAPGQMPVITSQTLPPMDSRIHQQDIVMHDAKPHLEQQTAMTTTTTTGPLHDHPSSAHAPRLLADDDQRLPCYACYRAHQPCVPRDDGPSCERCYHDWIPCNADGHEPRTVMRSVACLAVYRSLLDEARRSNSGRWRPVSAESKDWHLHGCRTLVHLAYLFSLQHLLSLRDYQDSGFSRGLEGMTPEYHAYLITLHRRLGRQDSRGSTSGSHRSAARSNSRRAGAGSSSSIRGTRAHDGRQTTPGTPPLPPTSSRSVSSAYAPSGAQDPTQRLHHIDASRAHFETTQNPRSSHSSAQSGGGSSSKPAPHPSSAPAPPPPPPSSGPDPTQHQLPDRLIPYRSLFTSQMSIADPELTNEMASARRFLEEEVPRVVARYNAQAIFSGKLPLANCGQIINDAIKRQQQGGS